MQVSKDQFFLKTSSRLRKKKKVFFNTKYRKLAELQTFKTKHRKITTLRELQSFNTTKYRKITTQLQSFDT